MRGMPAFFRACWYDIVFIYLYNYKVCLYVGYDCMHVNVFNTIFKKRVWENIVENGWNYDKLVEYYAIDSV